MVPIFVMVALSTSIWTSEGFVVPIATSATRKPPTISSSDFLDKPKRLTPPHFMAQEEEYSLEVRLREEAESPFRKVRYFFYLNISGGALISLLVSITRIAAALSGVNSDLMQESLTNAGVDITGLIVMGLLYKRDIEAENSQLKRATKGAELAKLTVRASKTLLLDPDEVAVGSTFTTSLASLRRGRGIEKRIVIAAAGKDKIDKVLRDAKELSDDMELNDLLIVPVVMPQGKSPLLDDGEILSSSVALPVVVGDNWKRMINDEAAEAVKQGVDIEKEGFCIVLKKNGRIGQRTRGIFLDNMVGNVVARREAGMDVTNV
jgi:hypothetical protein